MKRSLLVIALIASGCAGRETGFDAMRARAHVEMLATTIGSRPTGSSANVQARAYLTDQLSRLGFVVRVQDAEAVDARRGLTAHVHNIIAVRDGAVRDAIALISHYDSVADGPGALDDGLGVATCVESARVLGARPMRHSLLVVLTDGEELGLMGARAVATDPDVAGRLRAFLNFDGTGAAGPPLLFEAGPGLGAGLAAWASGAVAPAGASFGTEIYKRLPNDTDFTIFKTTGAIGLNFASIGDSYAYHTDRDRADRLQLSTIRQDGENAVGTVRALDESSLAAGQEPATFFDVAGWRGVVYGQATTRRLAWYACVTSTLAWLVLTAALWRARGWLGLLTSAVWAALYAGATFGGMVAAALALRSLRVELAPWYSAPRWFFLLLAATGACAAWAMSRLSAAVPERWRPWNSPLVIWCTTIPIWSALTLVVQRSAPAASYLFALPLGAIGTALLVMRRWPGLLRAISLVVFAMACVLGAGKLIILLGFLVALFGWLPVVTPIWLYPAVIAAMALVVLPPLLAAMRGLHLWRAWSPRLGVVLAIAVVVFGTLAYRSPAFTTDRPLRRVVRYVQDDVRNVAWWDISSMEPALGIDASVPAAAEWRRVDDAPPASVRIARLPWLFTFRTSTSPIVARAPATALASMSMSSGGRATLVVTVVPQRNLVARLVLPRGAVPIDSTLAGQASAGQWSAAYVAPSLDGLTVRMTLDQPPADLLSHVLIELTIAGVPGADAPGVPAWLASPLATWQARSTFVIQAQPSLLARVGTP